MSDGAPITGGGMSTGAGTTTPVGSGLSRLAPPEPIMNSEDDTQPHSWLRGWIDKYWGDPDKDRPTWKPNRGYVRRPDVVIVNDPTSSPTQDNIRMVVEIKFPNDDLGDGQLEAYIRIAGSFDKTVLLESSECDCNQVEDRERKAEELDKYAVPASQALYTLLRMYMRGRLPPCPVESLRPPPQYPETIYDRLSSRHEPRGICRSTSREHAGAAVPRGDAHAQEPPRLCGRGHRHHRHLVF